MQHVVKLDYMIWDDIYISVMLIQNVSILPYKKAQCIYEHNVALSYC